VDEKGGVATIVDHQLGAFAVGMGESAVGAPPVIFQGFAFPRENRKAGFCDRRGGMILRGKNIARSPAHTRAQIARAFQSKPRFAQSYAMTQVTRGTPAERLLGAYFSRIAIDQAFPFPRCRALSSPKSAKLISATL
jgi:hypothetical protein